MLAGAALVGAACGAALTVQARRIGAAHPSPATPTTVSSDPALGPFDADWPERDPT
jgi:hypothetical protein